MNAQKMQFRLTRIPKVSLKLMQMMKADREEAQDTMSIISGFTENSGPGVVRPRKAVDESLYKQVSLNRLNSLFRVSE